VAAGVIGLFAFGLYAQTIPFEFVWDDTHLIHGKGAPSTGSFLEIWTRPFPLGDGAYFRPLVLTMFWFENASFGLNPHVFHAIQSALYALCCVLVFCLLRTLVPTAGHRGRAGADLALPLWGALLFALHPVHVESVAFISASTDLLAGTLSIFAVLAAVLAVADPARLRAGWAAVSALSLFAGLLCKEMAIMTPALSWLAMRARVRERSSRNLLRVAGLQGIAVVGYLGLRILGIGSLVGTRPLEWGRPIDVLASFGRSIELLVLPVRLRVYHLAPAELAGSAFAALGAVALLALAAVGIASWRRRPVLSCCLLWIPLSLAPTVGIVSIPGATLAERFLFLPSVGICLLAALAAEEIAARTKTLAKARPAIIAVSCTILLLLGLRTGLRMPVYRSNLSLFEEIVAEYPGYYYGHLGVGMHHQQTGRPDLALAPLERAVRLGHNVPPGDKRYGEAQRWLGLAYMELGRAVDAIDQLEKAAAMRPEDAEVRVNLSLVYLQSGRIEAAARVLRDALALNPDLGQAELNLGIVLARKGARSEALPHFERAAALLPGLADVHFNLGNAYARLGRGAAAIASYRRALDLEPQHAAALRNLRVVETRQGAMEHAPGQ
jgi:tetratricopeptide (TPR) repeat protein